MKAAASWTGISGAKKINIDEGMLMDQASRSLASGHNPYPAQTRADQSSDQPALTPVT
jgi:hypothetical protein